MKCFACDILLDNPSIDRPTGRYYCDACFELTNEVILTLQEISVTDTLPKENIISIDELEEDLEEEAENEELDDFFRQT